MKYVYCFSQDHDTVREKEYPVSTLGMSMGTGLYCVYMKAIAIINFSVLYL